MSNNKIITTFALSNKKGGVLLTMTKEEKKLVLKLSVATEFLLERIERDYVADEVYMLIKELRAIAEK